MFYYFSCPPLPEPGGQRGGGQGGDHGRKHRDHAELAPHPADVNSEADFERENDIFERPVVYTIPV